MVNITDKSDIKMIDKITEAVHDDIMETRTKIVTSPELYDITSLKKRIVLNVHYTNTMRAE